MSPTSSYPPRTGSQTKTERKARVAQMRAEQERRDRRRRMAIYAGFAAVAVAIVAVVAVALVQPGGTTTPSAPQKMDVAQQIIPATPTGAAVIQQTPKQVPNTTGIDGVLAWDTTNWPGNGQAAAGAVEHDHVTGPVTYAVTPPIGGPHNALWMNAGVYTKPVPSERAVHNLEHGAIWITYDPKLPSAQVKQLRTLVGTQSMISESPQAERGLTGQANRYMDLSPWPTNDLPSPIVVSAWGYQLRVTSPTDRRIQQFIDTFRNSSKYTPEFGSAVDGIPVLTGGQPAGDGSVKPNPPGSAG
ncbi:MAG: DUF3105 domain-containing protein [Nocardioidaceae bacterium]